MRAWVTHGYDDLRLEEVPDPEPRPGWPVVRVGVVQPAITEVQLLKGERSSGYDVVAQRLAEGPQLLFGHEFCGEVVAVAPGESQVAVGDRVTALHSRHGTIGRHFPGCFSELAAVPADALVPVPDSVDDWEATALQPLSSCVRIVQDLGIGLGDVVLVLGQGVMGLNCAQVAKAAGARLVIGVDRRPDLLEVARRLGVDETIDASTEDVPARVQELTGGSGAPVVIEAASGSPKVGLSGGATVSEAVACVASGGTILSLAHYHEPVSLDFNVCRRKRLRYQFPPSGGGPQDMALAASLVGSRRVDLSSMITHRLDGLENLPEAIAITSDKARYGALNPAQVRVSGSD
ncbi:zinc-dependent alcohol dehydrogenase [Nocardioides humi]|uniref:Zinc-binding dehydrogenase n=1 Tax=Nocardioides humi TaxID=449461 RepID=A0ABN2A7T2_9ACTN|nr:zinc-binding dehydrogenase [Nocardioides humi]